MCLLVVEVDINPVVVIHQEAIHLKAIHQAPILQEATPAKVIPTKPVPIKVHIDSEHQKLLMEYREIPKAELKEVRQLSMIL